MKLYKSDYSWVAESILPVGDRMCRLFTMKRHTGELVTTATVGTVDQFGGFTMKMTEDYFKSVAKEKCRVTKNAVITQHNSVIANFDWIVDAVNKFYAEKELELA